MADFLMLLLRHQEQRKWEDYSIARITSEIRNANERVDLKKKPGGYSPQELMITIQQPKPQRTNGLDKIARLDALAARMGGEA